jgi:two-component system OmpR family response regulator
VTQVLLVEDSPTLRHVVTSALEARGLQVLSVESPDEAMTAARAEPPDVVIVNKMLPGVDGHTLILELRADASTAGARIMMLTESGRREDVVRSIEGGADDYVLKPFDPDVLAQRVEALLRRR